MEVPPFAMNESTSKSIVRESAGYRIPLKLGRVDTWYNPVSGPRDTTEQYLGCSKVCDYQLVKRYAAAIDGMRQDGTLRQLASSYLGQR